MTGLIILGIGSILATLSLNLAVGWDLNAGCPGTPAFCAGPWWTLTVQYLPLWLFLGNILVVLALACERAWIRL